MADAIKQGKQQFTLTRTAFEGELSSGVVNGECLYESLTEKLLIFLPSEAWLVSTGKDPYGDQWMVNMTGRMDRRRIWDTALALGTDGRKTWVVWRKEDAEAIAHAISSQSANS